MVQQEEVPAFMEWWCAVGRRAIGKQILLAAQHVLVSVGWSDFNHVIIPLSAGGAAAHQQPRELPG